MSTKHFIVVSSLDGTRYRVEPLFWTGAVWSSDRDAAKMLSWKAAQEIVDASPTWGPEAVQVGETVSMPSCLPNTTQFTTKGEPKCFVIRSKSAPFARGCEPT